MPAGHARLSSARRTPMTVDLYVSAPFHQQRLPSPTAGISSWGHHGSAPPAAAHSPHAYVDQVAPGDAQCATFTVLLSCSCSCLGGIVGRLCGWENGSACATCNLARRFGGDNTTLTSPGGILQQGHVYGGSRQVDIPHDAAADKDVLDGTLWQKVSGKRIGGR